MEIIIHFFYFAQNRRDDANRHNLRRSNALFRSSNCLFISSHSSLYNKDTPQRHCNLLMTEDTPPLSDNTKNIDQSKGKDYLSTAITHSWNIVWISVGKDGKKSLPKEEDYLIHKTADLWVFFSNGFPSSGVRFIP